MKYLYKYPQREFPYRDLVETNRAPLARGVRVRAARHRRLRRRPLLRRVRRVREGAARKTSSSASRSHNRGPEAARAPPAADAVVPQHLVVGRRRAEARRCAQVAPGVDRGLAPRARRRTRCVRRRAGAAVHRERDATRSASGASPTRRRTSRTRSTRTSSRAQRDAVNPAQVGHQGGGALRARRAGRRQPDGPPAARAATVRRATPSATSTRSSRSRIARRRRVLRADHARVARARTSAACIARRSPACCGASSTTTSTSSTWLSEHKSHPLLGVAAARRAEHRVVPHAQRRHHLDAGQVGVPVVRRLGPGLPHRRAGAGRLRLRQGPAAADAAQPLRPPERTDSRLRVELQRRQPAGARLGDALPLSRWSGRSAAPTCASWSARSRA